jgi:hypothetical protein
MRARDDKLGSHELINGSNNLDGTIAEWSFTHHIYSIRAI